jgi:hypothetical protein
LSKKISDRFPDTMTINKFSFLGMRPLSFLSQEDQEHYGEQKISELAEFYGSPKEGKLGKIDPILDTDSTKLEWKTVKTLVMNQQYRRANTQELWKTIHTFHSETVPNVITLARIGLVLPLHTSDVERAFSVQNSVKTAIRNRIGEQMVNSYLTVGIEGGPIEEFDFESAARVWRQEKKRHLFH